MTSPVYRSSRWAAVRKLVLARDGYRCRIGLPKCRGVATAVDHVAELEDGGAAYDLSNLQAACASCNASKRNRSLARRAKRAKVQRREW